MNKKERGFTLVELLAVIVILAIILLIAVPNVMGIIEKAKEDSYYNQLEMIEKMAKTYLMSNNVNYDENNETKITLTQLVDSGVAPEIIIDPRCGKEFIYEQTIITLTNNDGHVTTNIDVVTGCEIEEETVIVGQPIVEYPEGLVPITHNGTNWEVADTSNSNWYDYDNQEWANGVTITSNPSKSYSTVGTVIEEEDVMGYFVYIPRYKYQLFNTGVENVSEQTINIQFETKTTAKSTGNTDGSWLTHPAFTFGEEELNGIWVGKFENSGSEENITIKANEESMQSNTVNKHLQAIMSMESYHGLSYDADAHMMKNTEWGAVAYLSHSKYGINQEIRFNNNMNYITGCGANEGEIYASNDCEVPYGVLNQGHSTTGNITGIYDMAGGTNEFVMGVSSQIVSKSEIEFNDLDEKYFDNYMVSYDQNDFSMRILGDATTETSFWYVEYSYFAHSDASWFARGGDREGYEDIGIFVFSNTNGSGLNASRSVLIP